MQKHREGRRPRQPDAQRVRDGDNRVLLRSCSCRIWPYFLHKYIHFAKCWRLTQIPTQAKPIPIYAYMYTQVCRRMHKYFHTHQFPCSSDAVAFHVNGWPHWWRAGPLLGPTRTEPMQQRAGGGEKEFLMTDERCALPVCARRRELLDGETRG